MAVYSGLVLFFLLKKTSPARLHLCTTRYDAPHAARAAHLAFAGRQRGEHRRAGGDGEAHVLTKNPKSDHSKRGAVGH